MKGAVRGMNKGKRLSVLGKEFLRCGSIYLIPPKENGRSKQLKRRSDFKKLRPKGTKGLEGDPGGERGVYRKEGVEAVYTMGLVCKNKEGGDAAVTKGVFRKTTRGTS